MDEASPKHQSQESDLHEVAFPLTADRLGACNAPEWFGVLRITRTSWRHLEAEALSQYSRKCLSPLPNQEVDWKNQASFFLTGFAEGADRDIPLTSEKLEAEKSPGLGLAAAEHEWLSNYLGKV